MAEIVITTSNFEEEVLKSDVPVLVDFWAAWCGPCKMLSPIVKEIAEEVEGIKVGKVNVDEEPDLAMKYKIMSIPTIMIFQGGEVVNKAIGMQTKAGLLEMLKA